MKVELPLTLCNYFSCARNAVRISISECLFGPDSFSEIVLFYTVLIDGNSNISYSNNTYSIIHARWSFCWAMKVNEQDSQLVHCYSMIGSSLLPKWFIACKLFRVPLPIERPPMNKN